MATAPLVDIDTFADWLGQSLDEEIPRAEAVLSRVSALVRSQAGRTWVGEEVPDEVGAVVLEVATRVWNKGVVSESVGSYSVRYADRVAAGLYLTAEERSILGKYRANARGLWSLSTTRGDDYGDTVWVPVVGSDNLFPFLTSEDV